MHHPLYVYMKDEECAIFCMYIWIMTVDNGPLK